MNQTLTALDLFNQPSSAPKSDFKLRISAYGLLIENGQILLHLSSLNKKYSLPGGAIEIGESEREAVKREFLEETGYSVIATDIIDSGFKLFTFDNNYYHNVTLFYKVTRDSQTITVPTDTEESSGSQFISLNNINFDDIQPVFHDIIKKLI